MYVIANFITASAVVIAYILKIAYWLILIRAVSSWFSPDPRNQLVQFLHRVTEPMLQPIRQRLPMTMQIDISPIIAFLAIYFLQAFVPSTMFMFAASLVR